MTKEMNQEDVEMLVRMKKGMDDVVAEDGDLRHCINGIVTSSGNDESFKGAVAAAIVALHVENAELKTIVNNLASLIGDKL